MKKGMYFKLKLRRAMKLYPKIMLITILLVFGLILSCALLINKNDSREVKQKIRVGIVGNTTDTYLGIGVDVLTNIDVSRFSIDFVDLDEETAKSELNSGKLSGYLRIPDDFVDSIIVGKNIPLVYVTDDSPTGFGSIMMEEIGDVISKLITKSQDAIFGVEIIAKDHGKTENLNYKINRLNLEYIDNILNRSKIYETEYMGVSDRLSLGGYLVCGILMLFLLLFGIVCNSLLSKKDRSFDILLNSKGQSVTSQVVSEIISYFLVIFVTFMIFAVLSGTILQYVTLDIPELDNAMLFDYVGYIFKIIPVLLMISAMHVLFYDFVSGEVGTILFQFVFALGTGYISGCFYPGYFFSLSVQKIAECLPTGAGLSYLKQSMSHRLSKESFIFVAVYAVLFVVAAVLMRKYRMTGKDR